MLSWKFLLFRRAGTGCPGETGDPPAAIVRNAHMHPLVPLAIGLALACGYAQSGLGQTLAAVRPVVAAPGIPDSGRIDFRVLREGSEIGSHTLSFHRDGSRLTVDVAIDLNVTMLGFSLYRYSHRARETWEGNRLAALDTATEDNGKTARVSGRQAGDEFVVTSGASETVFPGNAMPSSHWNRNWLEGRPLINTQTGARIDFHADPGASETVETASGPRQAQRFAISGALRKDIWFDASGNWVKTRFDGPDGSSITYILQ